MNLFRSDTSPLQSNRATTYQWRRWRKISWIIPRLLVRYYKIVLFAGMLGLFLLGSTFLFYMIRTSPTERLYHSIFVVEPTKERVTSQLQKVFGDWWIGDPSTQPQTGDTLSPQTPTEAMPLITTLYEVLPGDTYWDIAKKTGLAIDTILSYNKVTNSYEVFPGRILTIPVYDGILHEWKEDESLAAISARYIISEEQIQYFNPTWAERDEDLFIPGAYFTTLERLEKLGGEFANPLGPNKDSVRITSLFGIRIHPITKKRSFHRGIDLAGAIGTPVYAAASGVVTIAREAYGYGNIVSISHGEGKATSYAHLSRYIVRPGQRVPRGKLIGYIGSSGISTGPHLHFEVWKNNQPINPLGITEFFTQPLR